jgi:hypothetical protein
MKLFKKSEFQQAPQTMVAQANHDRRKERKRPKKFKTPGWSLVAISQSHHFFLHRLKRLVLCILSFGSEHEPSTGHFGIFPRFPDIGPSSEAAAVRKAFETRRCGER